MIKVYLKTKINESLNTSQGTVAFKISIVNFEEYDFIERESFHFMAKTNNEINRQTLSISAMFRALIFIQENEKLQQHFLKDPKIEFLADSEDYYFIDTMNYSLYKWIKLDTKKISGTTGKINIFEIGNNPLKVIRMIDFINEYNYFDSLFFHM